MARVATVRWHTPPPTSVDEELAVYDDGSALLVSRRPATDAAAVGTFRCDVSDGERDDLVEVAGAQPLDVDLLDPATQGRSAVVARVAWEVAERARSAPLAVARFHGQPVGGSGGGPLTVALAVVGEGSAPVAFELDHTASAVHFHDQGGATLSWVTMPAPETGFVTPDAEGLGGLRGRAAVAPGQTGALAIEVDAPPGVRAIVVQVCGWLVETLPDAPQRQRFAVRTAAARLP